MPPSWHPVPACAPRRLCCRRAILFCSDKKWNRTRSVVAAGAGATPAAFYLGLCRLRGILFLPAPYDCAAGGPFFCAGDNPCSDSQIHPLKSGITAVLGLFLGKILQRFPSLTPEIRNRCSNGVVSEHSLQRFPSLPHEIKNRCSPWAILEGFPTVIPKSGPEIKNHCSTIAKTRVNLAAIPKFTP